MAGRIARELAAPQPANAQAVESVHVSWPAGGEGALSVCACRLEGRAVVTRKGKGGTVIGPVQLLMIGFKGAQPPDEVRKELDHLLIEHEHVRVIDVLTLVMHRNRTVERQQARDLLPALRRDSGDLVDRLLRGAGAAAVVGDSTSGGAGYLFRGDDIPQLRQHMRPGTGALILLLEHLWAVPLRDAVAESNAFPVADAWVGRTALQDLDLMPSTTSSAAGHAAR